MRDSQSKTRTAEFIVKENHYNKLSGMTGFNFIPTTLNAPYRTVYFTGKTNDLIEKTAINRDDIGLQISPESMSYLQRHNAYTGIMVDNGAF